MSCFILLHKFYTVRIYNRRQETSRTDRTNMMVELDRYATKDYGESIWYYISDGQQRPVPYRMRLVNIYICIVYYESKTYEVK